MNCLPSIITAGTPICKIRIFYRIDWKYQMIPQWESDPAVCRPGLCRNNLGTPAPSPFRAVRGIPACAHLRTMPWVFQRNLPRPTKKPWGFMLHGFDWVWDLFGGDAGSSCWTFLGWKEPPLRPPFRAVREIPACAPPASHARGVPAKPTPPNKKAMGLLRSMALIGLGIYSMAMRVDAGSSCWAFLGTVMLRTPDSYLHLISSGRRSPT